MGQWTPGKNFPATGAFGPWMVTPDELPPDRVLSLVCRLNGQEMQRTTTDLMMFGIAELIAFVSTFTTLEPGDVIVTGTPGGVGPAARSAGLDEARRRGRDRTGRRGRAAQSGRQGRGAAMSSVLTERIREQLARSGSANIANCLLKRGLRNTMLLGLSPMDAGPADPGGPGLDRALHSRARGSRHDGAVRHRARACTGAPSRSARPARCWCWHRPARCGPP